MIGFWWRLSPSRSRVKMTWFRSCSDRWCSRVDCGSQLIVELEGHVMCVLVCDKAQTPFTTSTAAAYIPTKLWITPRRSCWRVRERMSNSPERTDSIRIESIERKSKEIQSFPSFIMCVWGGGETGGIFTCCSHTSTNLPAIFWIRNI